MYESLKDELSEALITGLKSVQPSEHPQFITVTKVKGKKLVSFLIDYMSDEKLELREGVTLEIDKNLDISLDKAQGQVQVTISPPIKISYNLIGSINAKAVLHGMVLTKDNAQLRLKGVPDFKIELE